MSEESLMDMGIAAALLELEEEEKKKKANEATATSTTVTENNNDVDVMEEGENSSPFTADIVGRPNPEQLMREWRGQINADVAKIEALLTGNNNGGSAVTLPNNYFAFHP